MVDWIQVYSPEKELAVLVQLAEKGDQVDWKPAIILAAVYLERSSAARLKRHFEGRKITLSSKLDRLSLNDLATFLYGLELISEKYFTWMTQIWSERIDIVHPRGTLPAYVGNEANEKYGEMIRQALEIMSFLKS